MKAAVSLEEHFSPEEIDILHAITATQVRAELTGQDGVAGNPYSRGMRAWVEGQLSSDDDAFMTKSLDVAAKYDGIDKDRALHRILIERALQR